MSQARSRRYEELVLMEPELRAWAASRTDDPNLAHALVHHTIMTSWSQDRPDHPSATRTWLAELMLSTVGAMDCFSGMRRPAGAQAGGAL